MMNRKIIILIILTAVGAVRLFAQQELTLEQSVKLALQNSYMIEIAADELGIAKNNNSAGNAGFFPKVTAAASNNWSDANISQNMASGTTIEKDGVAGNSQNASLGFTWTLFDGTRMFVNKQRFGKMAHSEEFQYKMAVEEVVYKVMVQYMAIVKQQQQVSVTNELIDLYTKRMEVTKARKEAGSSSDVDLLQAGVDLNSQKSALLKQQAHLDVLKMQMGRLIANDPTFNFVVSDSVGPTGLADIELLKATMLAENYTLKVFELNVAVADLNIRDSRSSRYPRLGFGMNYNFARSESSAGYMLSNMNYGLNYGFSLSWNLFDGLGVSRSIRNNILSKKIASAMLNDTKLQLDLSFLSTYRQYRSNIEIVNMETQNLSAAKFSLDVAMQKYLIGSISDITLKEAQKSYEDAKMRLINARYDARINELDLLRLSGTLLK